MVSCDWKIIVGLQVKLIENFGFLQIDQLNQNRIRRERLWQQFKDDMNHKCSRVDNTFEEKEEELREFYSDLERKLHIHN